MDERVGVTFEIIVRAVFGVEEPARVARFLELTRKMVAAAHPALVFFPWTQLRFLGLTPFDRLRALRDEVDRLLPAECAARRASGARGSDVLSLLLDATYEHGAPVSDADLCDELVTLLSAGHETTSVAPSWALYELAGSPESTQTLRETLDAAGATSSALARLPMLDAVWQETLRLHPPLPDVLRAVLAPVTIGGHRVHAGENLVVALGLLQLDPEVFPEPEAFRPRRWIEARPPAFHHLPFGGGNRRCVGAALATFEAQIALAVLVGSLDLERVGTERTVRRNATMGPRHGVPLRVRARSPGAA